MALLPAIHGPEDVKRLTPEECSQLAQEIRDEILRTVSRQGGHLASNLGDVELTIALHRVFHSPDDKIIFDVGHQTYTHKLLTGRYENFGTLRSYEGLSGFPCHAESEHDLFDTGHSSTAISMALGLARARDLKGEDSRIVAVVGDGAITGGMCYEAMNDAGNKARPLIVVLNDNKMSISKNVGAVSSYFKHLRASSEWYGENRKIYSRLMKIPGIGKYLALLGKKFKKMVRSAMVDGDLFEALGFRYLGPFDGHNIEEMSRIFEQASQIKDKPVLIHVVTKKGKGYVPAEKQPEKYHGVGPFDLATGESTKKSSGPSAAAAAGEALVGIAAEHPEVVAITAAMADGTGLTAFQNQYPDRFFDVGIAEQHAVSMAAGLARGGMRPYFAVYSTFLQRAYDQMVHDVCLQDLPVCILADHAGLVGDDGKTHHGVLNVQMLLSLPNMTVLAPRDTAALQDAVRSSLTVQGPCTIFYPKEGIPRYAPDSDTFAPGKWQTLRKGKDCCILSFGRMTEYSLKAAEILAGKSVDAGVVDCCSLKPMDEELLSEIMTSGIPLITVEEGQEIGGFGSEIARRCIQAGAHAPVQIIGLPDRFVLHGPVAKLLDECRLQPEQIAGQIEARLKTTEEK